MIQAAGGEAAGTQSKVWPSNSQLLFRYIYIYIWVQRTTTSYFRTPRKIAGNKVEDSTQCQPEAAEEEKQTDDEAVEPPNEENTGSEEKEIGDENEENENEDGNEEEDENEDEFEDENKKKGTYKEIIDIYILHIYCWLHLPGNNFIKKTHGLNSIIYENISFCRILCRIELLFYPNQPNCQRLPLKPLRNWLQRKMAMTMLISWRLRER